MSADPNAARKAAKRVHGGALAPQGQAPQTEPSQDEIRRDIFAMIWPVTAENVLQLLIGFVNTGMVGRLGAATILAVGLSSRLANFVWIIFGAIGTGTTVLTARALGAGDQERMRRIAQQGLLLTFALMGIVAGIAYVFAPSLLMLLKITPEALPIGVTYLRILSFSMPFQALFLVISAILRGRGNTRTPMQIALVINLVTVGLNSVLIFGRLGFPRLGFRGPAVGTIAGQAVGAAIATWYLYSAGSGVGLSLKQRFPVDVPVMRRVLAIGIPSSAEMFFWQIAGIIIFRVINGFGTSAGAAYQLGLQAEGISYMPSVGFGIAATALVGRSLGAGNPHLAERYIKQIVLWGVALTAVATAILALGPRFLMRILTDDPEVILIGAQYLFIMAVSQIPQQVSGSLNGCLRGAGDTVTPMISAAVGIWGCRIPLSFLLSRGFGLMGIWWAINIDQFVRLLITGTRYLTGKWKTQVEAGQGLGESSSQQG
jgi:putative MATE family efflux protein